MIRQEKLAEFIANPPEEYWRKAYENLSNKYGRYYLSRISEQKRSTLRDAELTKIYIGLIEQKQLDDHLANEWLGE